MIYYLPLADGKPAAFDRDQLAICDDMSYWQDPPHRGRLYASLDSLKRDIESSTAYRQRMGFPATRYGWIEIVVGRAGNLTRRRTRSAKGTR